MKLTWASIDKLSELTPEEFSSLKPTDKHGSVFLTWSFLSALERSHCVMSSLSKSDQAQSAPPGANGWHSKHIVVRDQKENILALIPGYIKEHSYGEYVFDHSWAHAYQQHRQNYYPKYVAAVPFTPVSGSRVLLNQTLKVSIDSILSYISSLKTEILESLKLSSFHVLFASKLESNLLCAQQIHQRQSVQFNWHNKTYENFDDYLQCLTARRRRSIKKERKNISKQGLVLKRLHGSGLQKSDMQFFFKCYKQTYLKRSGHEGYLNQAFFDDIFENMLKHLLLVVAYRHDKPLAAALFFYDEHGLYGRYWGILPENNVDSSDEKAPSGLHFEACYYQGIEFCIEQNIAFFNPGTQGEHKILRGFEPTLCYSNHYMQDQAFDKAVADFVERESPEIVKYAAQAATLLPFKTKNEEN